MSSEKPSQCSNSSNRTGQRSTSRILPQTTLDVLLDPNYEESGQSFDHSKLQKHGHSENNLGYLQHIQSGNLIQPFGCLLAIDAKSLNVIEFSENAPEMLTAVSHTVSGVDDSPNLCIGVNVVSLFADPGATTLDKVLGFPDVSSLNPIIVQCKTSGNPFYAIVHHVAGCLGVDFEPVHPSEFPTAVVWASQPYKLAATAISKIQSLHGVSMDVLCNTLVEEVFDLMRYDRVMAYKFLEDYHGEVIAEMTKIRDIAIWLSDVHRDSTSLSFDNFQDAAYPGLASLGDMICGMAMAKITSSIILFWFRSHTASEIKWGGEKHNPSDRDDCRRMHPRLSFKAFLQVVRIKSLPWNDYEMDAIDSLQLMVRGSLNDANDLARVPHLNNYIDHLKSNVLPEVQAATREMFRLMETATVPIMAVDGNGLVCGWNLKVAQLTGLGADEVLGRHMLTLVEESSLPNVQRVLSLALRGIEEKEVILEVKTHGSKKGDGPVIMVVNACINRDLHEEVVEVSFVAQDMDVCKMSSEENTRNEGEVFINNPNLLTPMFGADKDGRCNEWNAAMAKLTGWHREEVLHKMLLGEFLIVAMHPAC
ncbi:hypothetical protein C2845_PM18G03830 [Panicum miliaceum]|uniref:Uncharacterized protein n=1 Tax=Panicum miliaceum TaxID=4540 RepID=A0A3L6PIX1_PANMI|nr:hypothetical protein C2845_PM18G03830 [Panicum miliaceum]